MIEGSEDDVGWVVSRVAARVVMLGAELPNVFERTECPQGFKGSCSSKHYGTTGQRAIAQR